MLGPCAEQIHPPTTLWSPCLLGLGVQAFTMPLHTSGPSCFAWLHPLQGGHLKPKAVSAANCLISRDPRSWQEGQMCRHLPDPNTMQLQPGLTKQGYTEFFP